MTVEKLLVCPECESDNVIVREVTSYMVNTGEYFCNSVRQHDSDASVYCLDCQFEGERHQLKESK